MPKEFTRKFTITCPQCNNLIHSRDTLSPLSFKCDNCHFDSTDRSCCVDVSYKDELSSALSNLYPHSFKLMYTHPNFTSAIKICSMESFLQGLKIKDPHIQYIFMTTYSGMDAKRMSDVLDGWKKDQLLYFSGKEYKRNSADYDELITKAYDALFETNVVFREVVLPRFKDYYIIHSIGSNDKSETVLTEAEFRYQITRLLKRLD